MYDRYFEHNLNAGYFTPQEEYQVVTAWCTLDGALCDLRTTRVKESEIADWASAQQLKASIPKQPVCVFQAIILKYDNNIGERVPCSAAVYRTLAEAWKFPAFFLYHVLSIEGGARYMEPSKGLAPTRSTRVHAYSLDRGGTSVCIAHMMAESRTAAFVMTNRPDELIALIAENKSLVGVPTLLPLIVLEDYIHNANMTRIEAQSECHGIAYDLGLTPFHNEAYAPPGRPWAPIFELTRCAHRTSRLLFGAKLTVQALDLLERMQGLFIKACVPNAADPDNEFLRTSAHEVTVQLDRWRQCLSVIVSDLEAVQVEIQASIQTVYSLNAQKDSRLNYKAAEASIKLAQIGRRDSADMRVISATTLIFLPATFVATFFSTTFFDFSPRGQGTNVSSWIWLYWVITAGLTAVVLLGWVLTSRFMTRRYQIEMPTLEDEVDDEDDNEEPSSNPSRASPPDTDKSRHGIRLRELRRRGKASLRSFRGV